jgi:hypothetical protein
LIGPSVVGQAWLWRAAQQRGSKVLHSELSTVTSIGAPARHTPAVGQFSNGGERWWQKEVEGGVGGVRRRWGAVASPGVMEAAVVRLEGTRGQRGGGGSTAGWWSWTRRRQAVVMCLNQRWVTAGHMTVVRQGHALPQLRDGPIAP